MRAAIIIYCIFLAIEAGLAWMVPSGNAFLAAAVMSGLFFYAAVWKIPGPWGELVRALTAGIIAVAGPLYYKSALVPTTMCFLALPHLLAATQCFWELTLGKDPAQQNQKMRTMVFTVAFYAAMGLVFVLLRGGEQAISRWITGPLAIAVLLMALPAWDLARVTRLKPGRARQPLAPGMLVRRILAGALVMIIVTLVFTLLLPPVAEKLCAISPRWRAKVDSPANKPPHGQPPPPAPPSGEATRPGMDTSAMTGQHELPQKSNIQSSGETQLFIRCRDKADAERMAAAGPVYVRSHTLDAYRDGVWRSSVMGGQWLKDDSDGTPDGFITLRKPPAALSPVEHTVFLKNADGYSLPALQNVCAWHLPQVYALHGELFQMQTAGSIRYDAVSAPAVFDQLPDRATIRTGRTGDRAQTDAGGDRLITELVLENPLLRGAFKNPADRIAGLRQWFTENIHYSTVMEGNPSISPLDNFIVGEHRGYCDFYASAAALMLRVAGIPTRVAYGYASREYDTQSGLFTFTDDSAHAWTEIYFEKYGWTVCDFTPPDHVGNLAATPPQRAPFDENAYSQTEKEKPPPPDNKKPDEFSLTAWWKDMVENILAMGAADLAKRVVTWIAAAAVALLLLRWLRQRQKKKAARRDDPFAADEHQPVYYAEFLRVFKEAGCPRAEGATPREYFSSLHTRGLAGEEFSPMISYHYGYRYADAAQDPAQERTWLSLVRETEHRMKQARPPA